MQQNPADLLREIEQLRSRTNQVLNHFSFPCMLFGALMVMGAVIGLMAGGDRAGIFWAVAGPLGGVATGLYYWRRESKLGVIDNPGPWIAMSLGIMVGCFATGFGGAALNLPVVSTLGPLLCISAGYLVFGRLAHSTALSVSAVALAIAVIGMWLTGAPDAAGHIGSAMYGAVTFFIGLMHRRQEVQV